MDLNLPHRHARFETDSAISFQTWTRWRTSGTRAHRSTKVSAGATVGFEVYEAWTERGTETTAVRSVEEMSPESRQLAVVLADLRQLARLIEATLDLVAAETIVAGLQRRNRAGVTDPLGWIQSFMRRSR